MADDLAQADPTATAAADAAENTSSQPDTSKMDLAQLDKLFSEGSVELPVADGGEGTATVEAAAAAPAAAPAVAEAAAEPAEPVVAAAEPDAAAEPVVAAAEPVVAAPVETEVERIQRPRLKDPVDQAIAAVKKAADTAGAPISWAEAERRVKGDTPEAETTEAAEATPEPAAVVATLTTEIAELERQLSELGDGERLYTAEHAKIGIDLAKKQADLVRAEFRAEQAESRVATQAEATRTASQTARAAAREKAVTKWPDAGDETTALGKAVAARIAELKNPAHPDHAILYADSAPLTIVRDVADELGIAPVAAKAAAAPPVVPVVTQQARPPVVSPASGARTSVPANIPPAADAKQTVEYLKNEASLEELDNLFGAGNLPALLAASAR